MAGSTAVPPTAPTRLRQIALIAQDLDRARRLLTTVLDSEVVFVDKQVEIWGIHNILVAIGGDMIEVCSPFKDNTPVGRMLKKRGDGGYMIIMQTLDAAARKRYIESRRLATHIFGYSHDDVECHQYHPRGIPGGMMPELDSHAPSPANPTPLEATFSPWHACGPDYASYSAGMKRRSHLKLLGATLRLAPGRDDLEAAAQLWQDYFGVARQGSELAFTNARLKFVPGVEGLPEGLESITIQITGQQRFDRVLETARREGLCGDGWVNMVGVKWYFVLEPEARGNKL